MGEIVTGVRGTQKSAAAPKRAILQHRTAYPHQVLDFDKPENPVHGTQKPVALMEYLIKTYTREGETVLDFTMGSGTTGVACKNLNRKFIGIELDETYFNLARERIENAGVPCVAAL